MYPFNCFRNDQYRLIWIYLLKVLILHSDKSINWKPTYVVIGWLPVVTNDSVISIHNILSKSIIFYCVLFTSWTQLRSSLWLGLKLILRKANKSILVNTDLPRKCIIKIKILLCVAVELKEKKKNVFH